MFNYLCMYSSIYLYIYFVFIYIVYIHIKTPSFLLVQVFISLPSPWVPDTLPSCRPWARATWSPTSQPAPAPCCHCSPSILGGIQPPKKRIEKTQSYSKMLVNCGRSLSFLSKGGAATATVHKFKRYPRPCSSLWVQSVQLLFWACDTKRSTPVTSWCMNPI